MKFSLLMFDNQPFWPKIVAGKPTDEMYLILVADTSEPFAGQWACALPINHDGSCPLAKAIEFYKSKHNWIWVRAGDALPNPDPSAWD